MNGSVRPNTLQERAPQPRRPGRFRGESLLKAMRRAIVAPLALRGSRRMRRERMLYEEQAENQNEQPIRSVRFSRLCHRQSFEESVPRFVDPTQLRAGKEGIVIGWGGRRNSTRLPESSRRLRSRVRPPGGFVRQSETRSNFLE